MRTSGTDGGGGESHYMISAGPSAESLGLFSDLLCRSFGGDDQRLPPAGASERGVRLVPNQRSYRVAGARVDHYELSSTYFPGELLSCGEGDWALVLVLPFELLCGPSIGPLIQLVRSIGDRPLALIVDDPRPFADPELRALARSELRSLLENSGSSQAPTPVLWCALREAIARPDTPEVSRILSDIKAWMIENAERPSRDPGLDPFLMAVEDSFPMAVDRALVTGRVERGSVAVGEMLLLRSRSTARKQVVGIEMFRKPLDEARAGDVVGLLMADTRAAEVERGDLLTGPRAEVVQRRRVRAVVHLQAREISGYQGGFEGAIYVLHMRTASHRATMSLATEHPWQWDREIEHSRTVVVDVELEEDCWFEPGLRFGLRIDGMGAGLGVLIAER